MGTCARQDVHRASLLQTDAQDGVAILRLYDPIDSWGGEGASLLRVREGASRTWATSRDPPPNSPGGEVFEGIAIMNQLRAHSARVVAVVDGLAASRCIVHRLRGRQTVMGRNAQLMIHDAWGLCVGNAQGHARRAAASTRSATTSHRCMPRSLAGPLRMRVRRCSRRRGTPPREAVIARLADSVAETRSRRTATTSLCSNMPAARMLRGRALGDQRGGPARSATGQGCVAEAS